MRLRMLFLKCVACASSRSRFVQTNMINRCKFSAMLTTTAGTITGLLNPEGEKCPNWYGLQKLLLFVKNYVTNIHFTTLVWKRIFRIFILLLRFKISTLNSSWVDTELNKLWLPQITSGNTTPWMYQGCRVECQGMSGPSPRQPLPAQVWRQPEFPCSCSRNPTRLVDP